MESSGRPFKCPVIGGFVAVRRGNAFPLGNCVAKNLAMTQFSAVLRCARPGFGHSLKATVPERGMRSAGSGWHHDDRVRQLGKAFSRFRSG